MFNSASRTFPELNNPECKNPDFFWDFQDFRDFLGIFHLLGEGEGTKLGEGERD